MTAVAEKVTYTPEDLLTRSELEHFELVRGELVEKAMGAESNEVIAQVLYRLLDFNARHRLGRVFASECGYQCFRDAPRKVRKPDVSFIRLGRLEGGRAPKGHIKIAPDLAVEVTSPNDLFSELTAKIDEYLRAGVPLVWVVDPESRTVTVYHQDVTALRLTEECELSGEDVLPGFSCRVRDLFPVDEAPVSV